MNERHRFDMTDPDAPPQYLASDGDERLIGRYAALARLSTSVRFNRPQREIIEDEAADVREELERRGHKFYKPGTKEPL